jgi:hypothetical protein
MIMIMPFAFGSTALASISAHSTQLGMKVGIASHKASAERTDIGAVATSSDALSHHLCHIAVNAGASTVFAVA